MKEKMWSSSSSIIFFFFFFSVVLIISPLPLVSSVSVQQSFLQCLTTTESQPKFPISEAVFTPSNSSFLPVLDSYIRNLRFQTPTTPKPLLIVAAKHESHVQSTVVCAKRVSLEIRIRSGGHDYEGLSYVSHQPFVVLDLFNLRAIDVDIPSETATVEAGATVGELYYAIAKQSNLHAFPAGVCPTMGAGGHISGGGYGALMRKFGLSVDNILDAKIVNVEGRILNREQMGEDLFWAIRGGGGASFGVILSWKIRLVPVPSMVTVFDVDRTIEEGGATDVALEWMDVADKVDENLFIRLHLHSANGTNGGKTGNANLLALYLGPTDELMEIVNQKIPSLKLKREECIEMSWFKSAMYWMNMRNGTAPEEFLKREAAAPFLKRKSDYVREPISREGMEAIWKAIIEIGEVGLACNPYGGKMSQISETETPFPHRAGVKFKIQYSANWKEAGDGEASRQVNMSRRLYEAMSPYVTKNPREAFLNYRDIDVGTTSRWNVAEAKVYGEKYFKGNYERLVNVKTKVDPQNFFRNEQSIPTR